MSIKYLDFDLLIERSLDRYRARVLESPAGEASIEFSVPFSQNEIDDFFTQIGQTRSFETQQIRKIHGFGQALFEAVFSGQVRDRLRASLGEANLQSAGLRIRLRLADTPELGNLPWEFIYDPGLNRFLALSVETPLVRYLETPQLSQPFAVQPPLRILAMICGPKDFPRLDVEREWENLQGSLQGLQSRYLVDLQRLFPPTLSALQQHLRREQYHIFHFIGHGTFSKSDQDGFLLLENEQRGGHRLSGRDLGTILHDHRPLRLVVLNACEGARTALDDQFAGTAQSLVQQGIPAVIAMQFRITDQAAITLAHEFYGALADGYPVDAALTEARKAIKTEGNDLEWGTPVLYMRSPDGRIFDIAPLPRSGRIPTPIQVQNPEKAARNERLYTEGLEAFYLGQWERAIQKFQAIIDSDPDHKDAAAKLETARHKMHVESLNENALSAEKTGELETALEVLQQLAGEEPGYPEISARIAKIRLQAQLNGLYAEAQQLAGAAKWQAVLGTFKEMDRLDPHHPDPDGLRSRSEQNLAKIKREAELESTYASALRSLDSANWTAAARQLRRVRQLQAGYRESTQLLHRAESELEQARTARSRKAIEVMDRRVPWRSAFSWISRYFSLTGGKDESLAIAFFAFAILGRGLAQMLGSAIGSIVRADRLPSLISAPIWMISAGLFSGLVFWWFLHNAAGRLDLKQVALVLGAGIIGQTAIVEIGIYFELPSLWHWCLLWGAFGIIIGLPIALISLKKRAIFSGKRLALIVIGWFLAYVLAVFISSSIRGYHIGIFRQVDEAAVIATTEQGVAAFIGGWFTLAQLGIGRGWRTNWLTVITAAIGLYLGNPFSNLIIGKPLFYQPWLLQMLIWGVVFGASLAFPSRNYRRYLALGLAAAIGMVLGQLAANAVDAVGVFQRLIFGAFLGLSLGLLTRRLTGSLCLSLITALAFVLRASIVDSVQFLAVSSSAVNPIAFPLGLAIAGAVIAIGWSLVKPDEPRPAV